MGLEVLIINFSVIFAFASEKNFDKIKNFLGNFTLFGISVPLFGLVFYMLQLLNSPEFDFSELAGQGCSDKFTLFELNQYSDDMDTYKLLVIFAVFFQFFGIFVNIIIIVSNAFGSELTGIKKNLKKNSNSKAEKKNVDLAHLEKNSNSKAEKKKC